MTPSPGIVTTSAETSSHLMNADVLSRRRPPERMDPIKQREEAQQAVGVTTYSPSPYMQLVSRLENMVRGQKLDPMALQQLRSQIGQNLTLMPETARRSIESLDEYANLGVDQFAALGDRLVSALQNPAQAQSALALLKQPRFAVHMKPNAGARVYGPQGMLRAS
ncbi:MAG: hypothetical protein IID61_18895 [SAR324 cluster bacterium]|nr:hypothetical protein [SAR324 cluster bacterium]